MAAIKQFSVILISMVVIVGILGSGAAIAASDSGSSDTKTGPPDHARNGTHSEDPKNTTNGNNSSDPKQANNGSQAGGSKNASKESNSNGGQNSNSGNDPGPSKNGNTAGSPEDSGNGSNAGPPEHAGNGSNAGPPEDAGNGNNAGPPEDADNGNDTGPPEHANDGNNGGPPDHAKATIEQDNESRASTAVFDEGAPLDSIAFENEVDGEVRVTKLDREPEFTGSPPGTAVSVKDIAVPVTATDEPATIRTTVPVEVFEDLDADPTHLRVIRFNESAGEWQVLPTTIIEQDDEHIVIEASTPGFSIFAVSVVSEPVADIGIEGAVFRGETITLSADGSWDRHGEIVSYTWDVDGERRTGETISVTLNQSGTHKIGLTVENDGGERDTVIMRIVLDEIVMIEYLNDSDVGEQSETLLEASLGIIAWSVVITLLSMMPFLRRFTR